MTNSLVRGDRGSDIVQLFNISETIINSNGDNDSITITGKMRNLQYMVADKKTLLKLRIPQIL